MIFNKIYHLITQFKNTNQENIIYKDSCKKDDFSLEHIRLIEKVKPFTMTSPERLFSLIESVKYLDKHHIEGDIVECGVWRGGSMMAVAILLNQLKDTKRHIYLYDTFEGMTEPTALDKKYSGEYAHTIFKEKAEEGIQWCQAGLEDVVNNFEQIGFDNSRLHFIKGKVEETLHQIKPDKIALLRLDTDWYFSTKCELELLYPRLVTQGVLIIDDYGHWQGCQKAVDEYFAEKVVFLNRVDYTCRLIIKP
jgi:hypothetical protein